MELNNTLLQCWGSCLSALSITLRIGIPRLACAPRKLNFGALRCIIFISDVFFVFFLFFGCFFSNTDLLICGTLPDNYPSFRYHQPVSWFEIVLVFRLSLFALSMRQNQGTVSNCSYCGLKLYPVWQCAHDGRGSIPNNILLLFSFSK